MPARQNPRREREEGPGTRPHTGPSPVRPPAASVSLSVVLRTPELRCSRRAGRHPAAESPQPPGTLAKGECYGAAGFVDSAPPARPRTGGNPVTVANAPLPAEGSDRRCSHLPHTAPCPSRLFDPTASILSGSKRGTDKYKNYRFYFTGHELRDFPGRLENSAPDAQEMTSVWRFHSLQEAKISF